MKYRVKRYWETSDEVEVEADSNEEAVELAYAVPVPDDAYIVVDSMNIDEEIDVEEIND